MKTIEFEGKKYEVEDWVEYAARDENGILGFEKQPKPDTSYYAVGWKMSFGKSCYIEYSPWQDSLTKV